MKQLFALVVVSLVASTVAAGNGVVWPAARPIPGEYIVVLANHNTNDVDAVAKGLASMHNGSVIVTLKHGVKAFGIRLPERAAAEALARNPLVDHVEENGELQLSDASPVLKSLLQTNQRARHLTPEPLANHCPWNGSYFLCDYGADTTFWHLDRIDNVGALYPYHAYAYNTTGANVDVYVLGQGILGTHEQFEGNVRAGITYGDSLPANNPCGGFPAHPDPTAPDYGPGHDTAVASVIAGNTNGVAKDATLIPVKIFNCDPNFGTLGNNSSSILWACWGLDWILGDATSFANANRRAVVNMSGGYTVAYANGLNCQTSPDPGSPTTNCLSAFENNVRQLVMNNIVFVASANNQNNGNCDTTPARMGYGNAAFDFHTITVGGSTEQDQRWVRLANEMIPGCNPPGCVDTGSNFGACVDIYAPAQHFGHLANIAANNSYRTYLPEQSGTSFSAPVVAGIAARLLQANPTWTPQQVWQNIHDTATHPGCFDTSVNPCNDRLVYMSPYN